MMRRKKASPQKVFDFTETAASIPEEVSEAPAMPSEAQVLEVFEGRYLEEDEWPEDDRTEKVEVYEGEGDALVPAPVPPEPPPINPKPEWRGPYRIGTRLRRFFLLCYSHRVKRKGNDVYGSLFQLGLAMRTAGFDAPIVMLDNIDEIHTKQGGIYPDDVLIFLSSDLDLVKQYAMRQFHWCNGAFIHCIASTDENVSVLWSYLVSLGCPEHKLHILRLKGGYVAHPSQAVAPHLWARLAPIYLPQKEEDSAGVEQ